MKAIIDAWRAADRWPRWLRALALLVFIVPWLPVLGLMVGLSSLPVSGGRDLTVLPQMAGAAASLVLTLPLVMTGLERMPQGSRILWDVAAVAFLALTAWSNATAGWPFLDTLVRGQPKRADHVIRDVTPGGDAKCHDAVHLAGLPLMWDRVCGVDPDVLRGLRPGMPVTVAGRGTDRWIIVTGIVDPRS